MLLIRRQLFELPLLIVSSFELADDDTVARRAEETLNSR
jgi:hypothetical protein